MSHKAWQVGPMFVESWIFVEFFFNLEALPGHVNLCDVLEACPRFKLCGLLDATDLMIWDELEIHVKGFRWI